LVYTIKQDSERLPLERSYQVIIIGAGPAGSTLAYELAAHRIKVLVLERAILPRYKCCAGGLTVKAAELLGININGLMDDVISGAIVTFKGSEPYYGHSSSPIMYTVMREGFDHALVKRARDAGADILQGVDACAIQIGSRGVEVTTAIGSFRGEFVAGADGATSRVARAMNIAKHNAHIVGLETEIRVTREELAKWKSRIAIDIGRVQGGYGWVFPKANHLSVGIACRSDKAKGLKRIFRDYLDSLKFGQHAIVKWTAGLLPVCVGQPVVAQGRAIVLGDAAGLADPLTGEGIYNAILSAQLGATAIEKALSSGKAALDDYSETVAVTIIPQMKLACVFSEVLSRVPFKLFRALNQDEKVWKACCDMLRGRMDYVTIKNIVSSLRGLYSLVSHTRWQMRRSFPTR
jgi:geranylgeranyl reductase family protein